MINYNLKDSEIDEDVIGDEKEVDTETESMLEKHPYRRKYMVKGTKTEQNLLKAFAGESQARNRYTMFASVARKEGYEKISEVFLNTASNEYEHANLFYKRLEGGPLEITASYPAGDKGTTLENLKYAANGEKEEAEELYPEFAKVAREEGFFEISDLFERISTIEKHHKERYEMLYNLVVNNFFARKDKVKWECRECGYIHEGNTPPVICPVCQHAKGFYQVNVDIY